MTADRRRSWRMPIARAALCSALAWLACASAVGAEEPSGQPGSAPTPAPVTAHSPASNAPVPLRTVGDRHEPGAVGRYIQVTGNVGPFGFPPDFVKLGGWRAWGKRVADELREDQMYKVFLWLPEGNTSPLGWRLLQTPRGGEIYDKSRPLPSGLKLIFDAGLYRHRSSNDEFERAVADNQAKTDALLTIRAAVDDVARTLQIPGGKGEVWVYFGNLFDAGDRPEHIPLAKRQPAVRAARVKRLLAPYKAGKVDGIAIDATSGAAPDSVEWEVARQILLDFPLVGCELWPVKGPSAQWGKDPRVTGFARGDWWYRRDDPTMVPNFFPREEVAGHLGVLCVAKPDNAAGTHGTIENVSRDEALRFIRDAASEGYDVYSNQRFTRFELLSAGVIAAPRSPALRPSPPPPTPPRAPPGK